MVILFSINHAQVFFPSDKNVASEADASTSDWFNAKQQRRGLLGAGSVGGYRPNQRRRETIVAEPGDGRGWGGGGSRRRRPGRWSRGGHCSARFPFLSKLSNFLYMTKYVISDDWARLLSLIRSEEFSHFLQHFLRAAPFLGKKAFPPKRW